MPCCIFNSHPCLQKLTSGRIEYTHWYSTHDQSARPVYDLSPWTPFYKTPPLLLYSAAEILQTIPRNARLIKIDLRSGFFQLPVHSCFWKYYGVYYKGQRWAWTRLPMGHPLAPVIMQRFSTAIARLLHRVCDVTMVAYLDDWLLFSQRPLPVATILARLTKAGITINRDKSILIPTTALVHLGLQIDTRTMQIRPTPQCVNHLLQLASVIPTANRMDLQRIARYMAGIRHGLAYVHGHSASQ
jgi:hypothetical protein